MPMEAKLIYFLAFKCGQNDVPKRYYFSILFPRSNNFSHEHTFSVYHVPNTSVTIGGYIRPLECERFLPLAEYVFARNPRGSSRPLPVMNGIFQVSPNIGYPSDHPQNLLMEKSLCGASSRPLPLWHLVKRTPGMAKRPKSICWRLHERRYQKRFQRKYMV